MSRATSIEPIYPTEPVFPLSVEQYHAMIETGVLTDDDPVTLRDGEPEPEGAVVRGSVDLYLDRHPSAGDVAMVIEVADTSLKRDRSAKLRSHARAGIGEYWIINLESRSIEVYTHPDPDSAAAEPGYGKRTDVPADGRVAFELDGAAAGEIEVAAVLP